MSALRNWLRCLVLGHRYDITELMMQRLVYCDCCNREIFNRPSHIAPTLKVTPTLSDIPFARVEGQAMEGMGEQAHQPIDAATAATIVEAINSGRLAATTSPAIAWQRKSLDTPRHITFIQCTGHADYLKPDMNNRRFWPINLGGRA